MAFVVDEYGGFAGFLTLEDLGEELVGDIRDTRTTSPSLPPSGTRTARDCRPGRWRLDEIADATGGKLPDSDLYETVSGLVLAVLGRVANVGDQATLP